MTTPTTMDANWQLGARFAQAMVDQDAATLETLIHPDAVWHFPGRDTVIAGDHAGPEKIYQFVTNVVALSGGTFGMDVHDVYGAESGAVIAFTGHGTRPDGRALNNPTRLQLGITDDQITELWEFVWDPEAVSAFWR